MGVLRFSESVTEPNDIVDEARRAGLNVICVTDHNTITGAVKASVYAKKYDDIEVVIGEEVSTKDGEVLALFIEEEIPARLSVEETINKIRQQGGIVVAPHPFSLHCPAIGDRMSELDVDAVEVLNSGHIDGYANERAREFAQSGRWAQLGGSDSHILNTIGYAYTTFPGNTAEDFRRGILQKKTTAEGKAMSLDKVVAWTVEVVFKSDLIMLKSVFGLNNDADPDDPIVMKIEAMKSWQKLVAMVGSFVYLLPPVPFLVGITGEKYLRRLSKAHRLKLRTLGEKALRKI